MGMDFKVEFYETENGACPVREFLDELKSSDSDDFAAVLAGLAKLRNRQYHREPLSKALGDGLFEPHSALQSPPLGAESRRTNANIEKHFGGRRIPAFQGGGLQLRHVGKLNTRVLWFFVKDRRIVAVHGIRNKSQAIPARDIETARERMGDWRKRAER